MKTKTTTFIIHKLFLLLLLSFSVHTFAGKRYYFVADYTLSGDAADYRFGTSAITIGILPFWDWGYPHNTIEIVKDHTIKGKTGTTFLDFLTSGHTGWWRLYFHNNKPTSMTDVDQTSYFHFWMRTTVTGKFDFTLYGSNGTEGTYIFDKNLPDKQRNGEWVEFNIPLSEFLDDNGEYTLDFSSPYTGDIFTLGGNGAGNILSFDDMYIIGAKASVCQSDETSFEN